MSRIFPVLETAVDEASGKVDMPLSRQQAVCQVTITGTQTVQLQGRLSEDYDWFVIKEVTASDAFLFSILPEIRAVTSATAGGSSKTAIAY